MFARHLVCRPAGRSCAFPTYQHQVTQSVNVVCEPLIATALEKQLMKGTVVTPECLLVPDLGGLHEEAVLLAELTFGRHRHDNRRAAHRGHLQQEPDLEDILNIMARGLDDLKATISDGAHHSDSHQLQERLTHGRARHTKLCSQGLYRVQHVGNQSTFGDGHAELNAGEVASRRRERKDRQAVEARITVDPNQHGARIHGARR